MSAERNRATSGAVLKEFAKAYGRGWARFFTASAVFAVFAIFAWAITAVELRLGGTWEMDKMTGALAIIGGVAGYIYLYFWGFR